MTQKMTSEFQKMAWANRPAPENPEMTITGSKIVPLSVPRGHTKHDPNKAFDFVKLFGPQLPDD
jgi:hypothetical protein